MIENVARPDTAIENLTNHQQQADMDGTFVKVSRQALDEVLSYLAAMQQAQEPVAWRYRWRNEEPVFLPSKRDWADYPNNAGWTETPLYAFSTPPAAGGSDAER